MKVSPSSLTLLLAIVYTTNNSYSFTLHTTTFRNNLKSKLSPPRTTLSAGFTTDAYLNSISQLENIIPPPSSLSASEAYLNSLNSFVVSINDDNSVITVKDDGIDASLLSLSDAVPYEVVTTSDYSVDNIQSENILIADASTASTPIDSTPSVISDVTTTLTPENFFMAEIPKSAIDASNDFISAVPISDTVDAATPASETAAAASDTLNAPASPETYFMKELTVSNNDNVIGSVVSDSTSSLTDNVINTPQSVVTDVIPDNIATSAAETASNAVKTTMEAVSSPPPPIAEPSSTKSVEGLADALSSMSYDNIVQESASSSTPKLSESLQQTRLNIPSFDVIKNVPSFDTNAPSLDAIKNTKVFSDLQGVAGSSFADVQNAAGTAIQTSKTQLIEQGNTAAQEVGQLSIKELGSIILSGLESFAKFVLLVIDDIAQIFGFGDDQFSSSNVFSTAYTSITELVNGASTTITSTIQDIGSMSVAQAAQSFVALVILIVKLLFQILNSIIEIITNGSTTLNSITGTAMASISTQADLLSSNVNSLTTEVGNTKLSDIAAMTGTFLQYSSDVMGQTYAAVMELTNGNAALGDYIDPSYFETFATALNSLTPNF